MEQTKTEGRRTARPNLIVMVIGVVLLCIACIVAFQDKEKALPIATAGVASLGTLGLALVRPDEDERVRALEQQKRDLETEMHRRELESLKGGGVVTMPEEFAREVFGHTRE